MRRFAIALAALLSGGALLLMIGFAVWAHFMFTVGVSMQGVIELGGLAAIVLVGGVTAIWLTATRRA